MIFSLKEFYNFSKEAKPCLWSGILVGSAFYLSFYSISRNFFEQGVYYACVLLVITIIIELYRKQSDPLAHIGMMLSGLVVVVMPFSIFAFVTQSSLNHDHYEPSILLGIFILIWVNDSFAYLCGSKFGKHKLFERISPKKSWEGAIGGGVFALLAAWILSMFFIKIDLLQWEIIALIVIIAGNYGDLIESLFKRSKGIKDSGSLLPGHGGLLDRFDSILFAVPAVYLYMKISGIVL